MTSYGDHFQAAASIWFEIWGSRGSRLKNLDFLRKFTKNFNFFQAISQQKNRFFRANFRVSFRRMFLSSGKNLRSGYLNVGVFGTG